MLTKRLFSFLFVVPAIALATATAHADEPAAAAPETTVAVEASPAVGARNARAPFGSRGQLTLDDMFGYRVGTVSASTPSALGVLSGASGIVAYSTSTTTTPDATGAPATYKATRLSFNPSVDYFVSDRISIGGSLGIGYQRTRSPFVTAEKTELVEQSGYALSIRPRVGYVVRITDDLVLWPRVGVGYAVSRAESSGAADVASRSLMKTFIAEAELGVVVRMGRYAYINVGPTLAVLSTSNEMGTQTEDASAVQGGARGAFGLIF